MALVAAAPSAAAAQSAEPAVQESTGAPTATLAGISDRPLLSLGDTGQSVAAWQRQMNILTGADLDVDGVYDTTTEQATSNFQAFFGLRADGIVGENTRTLMRYLLAITRDYTALVAYEGYEVNGYQSEGGFCFEVLAGDDWNVECGPLPPYEVSAQTVQVGERLVLLGSAQPTIGQVALDTGEPEAEPLPADMVADVRGTDRIVWVSALPPDSVDVVRAYDGDGVEVRAIVIDDERSIQILERGDRGPAVAQWQNDLNRLLGVGLAVDGIFGQNTVQVTTAFQAFFGLTADGIVGPETRTLVEYLLAISGR
nr:peptidoglycan-binding domain-containing protein [Rhabdothermincola salaria]